MMLRSPLVLLCLLRASAQGGSADWDKMYAESPELRELWNSKSLQAKLRESGGDDYKLIKMARTDPEMRRFLQLTAKEVGGDKEQPSTAREKEKKDKKASKAEERQGSSAVATQSAPKKKKPKKAKAPNKARELKELLEWDEQLEEMWSSSELRDKIRDNVDDKQKMRELCRTDREVWRFVRRVVKLMGGDQHLEKDAKVVSDRAVDFFSDPTNQKMMNDLFDQKLAETGDPKTAFKKMKEDIFSGAAEKSAALDAKASELKDSDLKDLLEKHPELIEVMKNETLQRKLQSSSPEEVDEMAKQDPSIATFLAHLKGLSGRPMKPASGEL